MQPDFNIGSSLSVGRKETSWPWGLWLGWTWTRWRLGREEGDTMEDNAADSEADRKNSDDVGGRNRPSKKYHTFSNTLQLTKGDIW